MILLHTQGCTQYIQMTLSFGKIKTIQGCQQGL